MQQRSKIERKRSSFEISEKGGFEDEVVLDLAGDRRRWIVHCDRVPSERRPIKRDINHNARKDRALVCMRRERKWSRAI